MSRRASSRILVNGLPPDTTYDMVGSYFAQFGTLIECEVFFEEESNNCRGYAFVRFLDNRCAEECLRSQSPFNGVRVLLRPISKTVNDDVMNKVTVKKILLSYLGGLLSRHQIYEYFSDFGRVKIDYCGDDEGGEHYAYVMFEDEFACRTCLAICEHIIDGCIVEIRAVVRKEELMKAEQAERENVERRAVDLAIRSEFELRHMGGTQFDPPLVTVAPYCQQQGSDLAKTQQRSDQSYILSSANKGASSAVDVSSDYINCAAQIPTSYATNICTNNQRLAQQLPILKTVPDCTLSPSPISVNRNVAAPTTSTYTLKRQQITSFTSHSNPASIHHPQYAYSQRQWEEDEPLTKLSAHDGTLSSALAGYGSWGRRRNEVTHDVHSTFNYNAAPLLRSNAGRGQLNSTSRAFF
uniref:RRM domain-containing protein n=1 Tax=Parascaris univalens TaxID=6257 RepID=A0A915C7I4_PARUN